MILLILGYDGLYCGCNNRQKKSQALLLYNFIIPKVDLINLSCFSKAEEKRKNHQKN